MHKRNKVMYICTTMANELLCAMYGYIMTSATNTNTPYRIEMQISMRTDSDGDL